VSNSATVRPMELKARRQQVMEIIIGMRIIANESRLSIDATVKLSVIMSENNNRNKNITLKKIQ
jgi:hypothetical protein